MQTRPPDALTGDVSGYAEARKHVEKARTVGVFRFHALAYVLGNAFLGGWNALAHFTRQDQVPWFFMPLIFWGLALLIHYVHSVALFDDWWGRSEAALEAKGQQIKDLERRRLSGELHDETLAQLASIAAELGVLARRAEGVSPELQAGLNDLRRRTKGAEARLREIVQGIFPSSLATLGLVPAVRAFLEDLASREIDNSTPVLVGLSTSGVGDERLPEDVEVAAYRAVQQGITNAVQHARATRIDVELACTESELRFAVTDDGVGFDVSRSKELAASGHFGLASLRSRIEGLGGQVQVESSPSAGTAIRARIPTPTRGALHQGAQKLMYVLSVRGSRHADNGGS